MTTRSRPRVYAREFKVGLLQQWIGGERSCAQLVREHGIAQSVLYRWRAEYQQLGEAAFRERALTPEQLAEQRIGELERALGQATLEIQVLKKGLRLAQVRSDRP